MRKCVVAIALVLTVFSSPIANPVVHKTTADERCLANAIFYESRGEPIIGRRAVYDVILHRMVDRGKTACAIIREPGQFQWARTKVMMPMTYELQEMLTEVVNSRKVLNNEMFFHSKEVKPSWARQMICRRIHNQHFCASRSNPKEK